MIKPKSSKFSVIRSVFVYKNSQERFMSKVFIANISISFFNFFFFSNFINYLLIFFLNKSLKYMISLLFHSIYIYSNKIIYI